MFDRLHFKEGLLGEITGFGGGGNPDTHNLDDAAYEDYFNKAMGDIRGASAGTAGARGQINNALQGQLAGLENNAAGRKKNFEEDMSRSFGDTIQQRARAAGGTGNLAQVLNPGGAAYDAQARQTARGYNDLYSQATRDLGSLEGIQSDLYNQDYRQGAAAADLNMRRINQRLGIAEGNAANDRNADAVGAARRTNTIYGLAQAGGQAFGGKGGF